MSTAYHDVQHALGLLDHVCREKAEQYRALELLRLDAMTLCLSPKIDSGDTKAILVAVKIMERHTRRNAQTLARVRRWRERKRQQWVALGSD